MKLELLQLALSITDEAQPTGYQKNFVDANKPSVIKKVKDRGISYAERHRGSWYKPEYDLEEISIAQDTDSYIYRALKKKNNRFLISGCEIVGFNEEYVNYVKRRVSEIETAQNKPFYILLTETAFDLDRYSNCMWVKARDPEVSSGKKRTLYTGKEIDPVAAYFILPFETLYFKSKMNGEIKKVLQETPSGETKEFFPEDLIHFYDNKKPGFTMGTPALLPVLQDVSLLRRLEENVEELIESNLFPLFHYTVGTDEYPERYSPDGYKETEIVRKSIDYMPAGGVYVSDHRHKISAIGSQGKALQIESYLDYFKKRVFSGLGVSSVDMGESDTANRATANVLSKSAIQDVEALQEIIRNFVEFYVFKELLLEGGYEFDLHDPMKKVSIKFGSVDKEQQIKIENQATQLFNNNLLTKNEARKRIGEKPFSQEDELQTNFELHQKPLALLKFPGASIDGSVENTSMPENQFGKNTSPNLE
jgi:hypothetical protein